MNKKMTVVTPTFNRSYKLGDCYNSLKSQSNMQFVWMIIDDGSTDNTEELVSEWIGENIIEIKYFKKNNGGKASALNYAMDRIITNYWVCLDSDDIFAPKAIEMSLKRLEGIKGDKRYCGLLVLSSKKNGEPFGGKKIPGEIKETTVFELSEKYKFKTEYTQFYILEATNNYRFPQIPGEKFISPEYFARELDKKYKFIVDHNIYTLCEYLPDGLTKNKIEIIKKNPKGYTLIMKQNFERSNSFFNKSIHCLKYISGGILTGSKGFIKDSPHKLMTILYYPLGWLVYRLRFK